MLEAKQLEVFRNHDNSSSVDSKTLIQWVKQNLLALRRQSKGTGLEEKERNAGKKSSCIVLTYVFHFCHQIPPT